MIHLGFYNTSTSRTHVGFQFPTFAAAGGNVAPLSAFEPADLRIYRAADGAAFSATQRSSSSGIAMTSPFDSLVGYHDVDIDLTDNADAGFYASGYRYIVTLAPDTETIDGQTITGVPLAFFEIGVQHVDSIQVNGSAAAALRLGLAAAGMTIGTISNANFSPTTTRFRCSDITKVLGNHFLGQIVKFTSGTLNGSVAKITAYSLISSEGDFTVAAMDNGAMPGSPANGDTIIIL